MTSGPERDRKAGDPPGEPGESGVRIEPRIQSADPAAGSAPTLGASPAASPGPGQPTDLAIGTVLDGVYRVEKRIGRGAMGTVYLVEHLRLGRRFAAKVVSEKHASDPDVSMRLRNEARVASKIQHENIVDVTHLGTTEDGSLFIVMELLQGRDLRESMLQRRERGEPVMPEAELRAIAADVMSGLAAAHAEGIVHRDLKPENVFLVKKDGRQRAKIVDFGISKSTHGAEDLRLTRTGQIIGTPLYMAPEQSRSTSRVDARADVYALGVMLYELLTGRLPFEATTLYDVILQHATEPPPPLRSIRAEVLPSIDRVVRKCLAKAPADRWQTVDELRAAWDAAWEDPGAYPELEPPRPAAPAAAPRASSAPLVAGVAIVALVLAGALAWRSIDAADDGPPAPAPVVAVAPPPAPPEIAPPEAALPTAAPDPAPAPPAPARRHVIRSEPPGATVRVGGQDVGTTPYDLEVPAGGTVSLELRLPRHDPATRAIGPEDPREITIRLRHRAGPTKSGPGLAPR